MHRNSCSLARKGMFKVAGKVGVDDTLATLKMSAPLKRH